MSYSPFNFATIWIRRAACRPEATVMRDHEGKNNRREPMPPGGGHVGHLDQHRPDREDLDEHLDLAQSDGGEVHAVGLGHVTQDRDIDFAHDENADDRPMDDAQRHRPPVEELAARR